MTKLGKSNSSRETRQPKVRSTPEVRWERVVYDLFERVVSDHPWDGNTSLVKGAIRARDWLTVLGATKAKSPQLYSDAALYFAACQVEHLFKKLPIPGSEAAAEKAAWDQFRSDEKRNRRTNQKFRILASRDYRFNNPMYTRLLGRMQAFMAKVLGPSPDFEAIYGCCDFGPGSSVGVGGSATHPYAKMDTVTCSAGALPYLMDAIWLNDQWRDLYMDGRPLDGGWYVSCVDPTVFASNLRGAVELVGYNKIDFVEKNYHIKRSTAGEPVGNGYLQIGAGDVIATRLRRYRNHLNIWDQTRNQRLARLGSLCDTRWPLATLDMKSASQSLVREMVRAVLAHVPDWFDFLNRIRSHHYVSKHGEGSYELFVSMGNGFCFPLQTAIFAAAVEAVYAETGGDLYGVYGDDIIVDQSSALLLMEWLKELGVRTNRDKSFIFGPFRESCGADFFNGENVRPYVLDFIPTCGRDLVKIANGFTEHAGRPSWSAWWGLWNFMPKYARRTIRPHRGPDDTGLTVPVSFYELHKLDEYDDDLQRSKLRCFKTTSLTDDHPWKSGSHPSGQLLLALRGASPKQQEKVRLGRDAPVDTSTGTPLPCFRRKTKTYMLTA